MAIVILIEQPDWMTKEELREVVLSGLPGADVRCWPDLGDGSEVEMLVTDRLSPGVLGKMPNLQLIQKLGAGVDTIVRDPDLREGVRVCRLKPSAASAEIAEFCLYYVAQAARHFRTYENDQANKDWIMRDFPPATETTVGVLGLGYIGGRVARTFASLDYDVCGWSRSEKSIPGVRSLHGEAALDEVLSQSDYVISVLPSTDFTRRLMGDARFAAMRKGASFINVGRGDLIVEEALSAALSSGHLAGAVLDVMPIEPLPQDHPFWTQRNLTITPHISGWHLNEGFDDVVENYRRLQAGEALLHEVSVTDGY